MKADEPKAFCPKAPDPNAPAEDGLPNKEAPIPVGIGGTGGILEGATIDARKGLAPPPPVICGRNPEPRLEPLLKLLLPKLPPAAVEFMVLLKPPVLLNPPVGCEFSVPTLGDCVLKPPNPPVFWVISPNAEPFAGEVADEEDAPAPGPAPVTAGVFGSDAGIGGNDSNNEAPKDEVGLNGFKALNPVV